MGFPENKKLAKDINKNTEDCTKQLETLLVSLNSQMGLMNSLISSISGGYVSKDYVDTAMPVGVILMWSGSVNTIPSGFALCDGSNGTPDLRNRFVIGAGSTYAVGAKGEASAIDLSHTHNYEGTTSQASESTGTHSATMQGTLSQKMHTHTYSGTTDSAGSTQQSILPPYYALCYIMKTGSVSSGGSSSGGSSSGGSSSGGNHDAI